MAHRGVNLCPAWRDASPNGPFAVVFASSGGLYPEGGLNSELEEWYVESHLLGSTEVQRNNTGSGCNMRGIVSVVYVGLSMILCAGLNCPLSTGQRRSMGAFCSFRDACIQYHLSIPKIKIQVKCPYRFSASYRNVYYLCKVLRVHNERNQVLALHARPPCYLDESSSVRNRAVDQGFKDRCRKSLPDGLCTSYSTLNSTNYLE